MHAEIATRRDEIAELCRGHRVLRLEVFGSAARGTDFDPVSSDADFLVQFDMSGGSGGLRRHFGFQEALAAALGREVDLLSALPKNKYLLASINEDRELVFDSGRDA
ncbi:MAG: DNA polymerase III subunit beta [Boseongicola sp. SB0662_bin_57]|nr:DNA polymerase III subunit beta [Boseongicola sp. SB0662_bin_57]